MKPSRPDVGDYASSMVANTLQNLLKGAPGHVMLDASQLRRDPAVEGALDSTGSLIVRPAAFWARAISAGTNYICWWGE